MGNPGNAQHLLHSLTYLGRKEPEAITMATILLNAGCHVNCSSLITKETPLHKTASLGLKDFALLYLQHGADFTLQDRMEQTPFVNAVWMSKWEICEILLSAGAHFPHDHLLPSVEGFSSEQLELLRKCSLTVPKLCYLCRNKVRKHMKLPLRKNVSELAVPIGVRQFICMDDIA